MIKTLAIHYNYRPTCVFCEKVKRHTYTHVIMLFFKREILVLLFYYNYIRLFVDQIPIKKTKSGYGFTVSGFSPVFVCRVEKGECHNNEKIA